MKQYKVWIHIEEIDEDADTYEDIGMPVSLGTWDKYDHAVQTVSALTGIPEEGIRWNCQSLQTKPDKK